MSRAWNTIGLWLRRTLVLYGIMELFEAAINLS